MSETKVLSFEESFNMLTRMLTDPEYENQLWEETFNESYKSLLEEYPTLSLSDSELRVMKFTVHLATAVASSLSALHDALVEGLQKHNDDPEKMAKLLDAFQKYVEPNDTDAASALDALKTLSKLGVR